MTERSESMEMVFSNCMGGRTKEDAVETGTEGAVAEFDATDGATIALDLFLASNGQYQNSITDSTSNGDRGGNDDEGHASKEVSNMLMGVRVCGVLYYVMYSMVTRRIGQHGREPCTIVNRVGRERVSSRERESSREIEKGEKKKIKRSVSGDTHTQQEHGHRAIVRLVHWYTTDEHGDMEVEERSAVRVCLCTL